ncbi:RNA-directed DNA polymerase [Vibrio crassostreae]|uniref:RNA-directed DNA polymerase n=1 Tax=Vibrio crassostreae TaxID=246167 RepID=UPI000F489D3B|nr:RNA-directed DNA polymerase [Vibrio crassostreae]ROQ79729.1 reverse transcriptase (RNA-dependent DNA polymerase) [Vibrio crassostreae]
MLLHKKYNKILPTGDFIYDEVILLSAWKKSHQHIRGVNWYVDCLDLDKSALELDLRVSSLSVALRESDLELSPLKLIPAPKSHPWEFLKSDDESNLTWVPESKDRDEDDSDNPRLPMRPLAHVSIDDQTVFTALMMLLANHVETKQGDTSTLFSDVHDKGLINYGNRLHCKYVDNNASYSWGNSTTYSKFFTDYQRFLERPIYFGREAKRVKTSQEEIYEIHLDFSKFYDSVDRAILSEKVEGLIKEITGKEADDCISHILDQFKDWEWTEGSQDLYVDVCKNEHIQTLEDNKGIPQGLVAGGFLANIYMLDFDNEVAELIGQHLDEDENILLIDACRYVDDLRLIIKANKNEVSENEIRDVIATRFKPFQDELGLILQPQKTKVKKFSSKEGAISSKLAQIQNKLSGPMPLHELDEQLGHLEGLIELTDNLEVEDWENKQFGDDCISELAFIDKTFNDVRKDTLLRFTANKIHSLLRQKRSMIAQEVTPSGEPISGSWDYLQERMARKLISKWTKDPSLLLLLKKGIELFPHARLLRPILQSLESIRDQNDPALTSFAEYCLSEVLRHSATAIHTKDRWAFPAHSDPESYFECLEDYACSKFAALDTFGEAFKEQILFFSLVRNDSPLKEAVDSEPFDLITQLLNGFRSVNLKLKPTEFTTAILLANQLALDKRKVMRSISSALELIYSRPARQTPFSRPQRLRLLNRGDLGNICKRLMLNSPELFEQLYSKAKSTNLKWPKKAYPFANYLGLDDYSKIQGTLSFYNEKSVSLLSVIRADNSPFKHENGILKLVQSSLAEIDKNNFDTPIDIANTKVRCSDWDDLLSLKSSCELKVELEFYDDETELFHTPPQWLTDEHKPLYYIGMFIRSCLLGSVDWSSSANNQSEKPAYRGIKSNMLKRQIGMMHSPEALGNSKAPMSTWLSTLLFKLLQWPGVESNDSLYSWPTVWTLDRLENCIKERTDDQTKSYCTLSNMPTYTEKVKLDWLKNKKHLNVVMVQSLLPLIKDFQLNGLKLDTPTYRAKHRRHVASVSELVLHNIASVDSVNEIPNLKGKVDLIVWPELSVSPDDLDILERLSDKTGAIVFAGIGFSHIHNERDLNNSAMWIIPNKGAHGRRFIKRLQGKQNMTVGEANQIAPWRPYQLIVEMIHPAFEEKEGFKLTGSICYDATDIKLSADLKNKSHAYIISAMNKDIATFDSMVDALFYHMYQYVVLVNSGQFGGSVAKAPYKERFHKLITHTHGAHQVSISTFEMNMFDFRDCGQSLRTNKKTKTPPAGNMK